MYELPQYLDDHLKALAHQYYDISNHAANEMFGVGLKDLTEEQIVEVTSVVSSRWAEHLIKAFAS